MPAHDDQTPLPLRAHTILGVCEAIGEDFGFSPNWLRIPLAASVLVSPTTAVAAYVALGVVVLASRLLFPKPKAAAAAEADANSETLAANDPTQQDDLRVAA